MKNQIFILSFLSLFIILSSCSDDEIVLSEQSNPAVNVEIAEDEGHGATEEANFTISDSEIFLDDLTTKVEGNSKLTRSEDSIEIVFEASNIPNLDIRGHAVTLWAAIYRNLDNFNNDPLILNPHSLYLVDGYVVNSKEDNIQLDGTIKMGAKSDLMVGEPLVNPENDVVLFYVKSNGIASVNPKILWAQLNSFSGGCQDGPDGFGSSTPCYDEFLFSVHQ